MTASRVSAAVTRSKSAADLWRAEQRRSRARKVMRAALGVAVTLLAWQGLAKAYNLEVILPPPLTVVKNTYNVLTLHGPWQYGANMYAQVGMSLVRAMTGFALGIAAAMPLGILIGRVRWAREVIGPVFKIFYPIPSIAWVPLTILWFGLGAKAIIAMVALGVFFPVLYNVEAGARAVQPILIDAARCYGAKGFGLFRKVILPSSVPFLASGLRIGIGDAWRLVVAGEIVVGQSGVGYILNQSRFLFRTEDLITGMIAVAIIGYATERLVVGTLEKRTLEIWQPPVT